MATNDENQHLLETNAQEADAERERAAAAERERVAAAAERVWLRKCARLALLFRAYYLVVGPAELAFFPDGLPSLPMVVLDCLVGIVLLGYFLLQIRTALRRCKNRWCLALILTLDFISAFPLDVIYKESLWEPLRFLLLARVYHLWRLDVHLQRLMPRRVDRLDEVDEGHWMTSIYRFIIDIYAHHLVGCGLYMMACFSSSNPAETWMGKVPIAGEGFKNSGFWKLYQIALYFTVVTFTSTGYGDIHPYNVREMTVMNVLLLAKFHAKLGVIVSRILGWLPKDIPSEPETTEIEPPPGQHPAV